MKTAGVVVLYNPENDFVQNILSYFDMIDILIVIDNSPFPNNRTKELRALSGVIYLGEGRNHGIAKALNIAAEISIKNNCDWLLTMDQDSYFIQEEKVKYISCFKQIKLDRTIGVVGTSYGDGKNNWISEVECLITDVSHLITSGSFINLEIFKIAGPFDEKLFIDEVDTDYCYKVLLKGFRVCLIENVRMNHALGRNIAVRNFYFGRKVVRNIHSANRIYYIVRNFLYMYKVYHKKFPDDLRKNLKITLNRIKNCILYSGEPFKAIKMMFIGVVHNYRQRFGPY